jgi:2-succinyl-5-enolpyruvyl-6-hydroxy-3-cyclohexene-1-carboxylate synthase
MSAGDLHTAWARLFVASLASSGLHSAVLSPGSRSTPLALALAAQTRIKTHVIVDERAAAFFALGQARASGQPSLLLCTSGSAGGHYLPAMIEAAHSHLPLIAVTADRPWDAYDATSSQTIDQVKLFGDYVRHYAELGLPDPQPSALRAVVRIAAQAVAYSRAPLPGPVHINARFRKPLEPIATDGNEPWRAHIERLHRRGAPRVFSTSGPGVGAAIDADALRCLALLCRERPRGLIVAGPAWAGTDAVALRTAVAALQAVTGFPIWAEATSGLRFGSDATVHGGFDALLHSPGWRSAIAPQLILELGGPPVSGTYASFVAGLSDCFRAVVAPHGWNDPQGGADLLLAADPAALCLALPQHPLLHDQPPLPPAVMAWRDQLAWAEAGIVAAADAECSDGVFSEAAIVREVVSALPAGATLMLGNSLAVREVDMFCPPSGKPLRVLHQRGAAGIDGLIAGAAGARLQTANTEPLVLFTGDLSALHDLGGLATLAEVTGPLAIVVVNNSGGRIFEQLPVAASPTAAPLFERVFVAPQRIDLVAAASSFDVPAVRVADLPALRTALQAALQSHRPMLIEAVVPPTDGGERRQRLLQQLRTSLPVPDGLAPAPLPGAAILGAAPTVFLHGFLGGPESWQPLIRRLPGPCYAEYLPGHGPAPQRLGDDFDSAVAALAQRLPATFHLVGYSLGARLALALALHAPERVASLLLVGVDLGFPDGADAERRSRQAWEDGLCQQLASAPLPEFVATWERLPIFATQDRLPADLREAQRRSRLNHDADGLIWSLRTLGTGRMPDLWSRLSALRCPVRVVSGSLDEKFVRIGQALAAQRPEISHIVLPNIGHNAVLEAPDAIYHLLRTPHGHS